MKKLLLLSTFILPFFAAAQQTEDFSDGNFTSNPAWNGDVSQFTVNASFQLQLNSSGTNISYLSASNNLASLDSIEWSCYIKQSFSPSSANYGRVYLVSDQSNLEGPLNGYYLQFGEALSNDAVELFCQTGTTSTSVCRGTNAQIANSFTLGVRVTRNGSGLWSLYADAAGGTNYLFETSGTNTTFSSSSFFGVVCSYTSGNATGFYYDNFFVGPIVPDNVPPKVLSASTIVDSLLNVKFNEAMDQTSSEIPGNYFVNNGIGNPVSAQRDASDFTIVHLTFSTHFTEGLENILAVTNVSDVSLNVISSGNTKQFTFYNPHPADSGDVVINEVLFSARTGGVEFMEIYNRSHKAIYLNSLKLTRLPDPSVVLTVNNEILVPNGYMVLTDNPSIVKSQYFTENPNAFLQMNLPDLHIDEDILVLQGTSSQTFDQLHYFSSWHFPLLNDLHGVSLERLNPNRPTQNQTNWHSAAESAGFATPGYRNSQNDNSAGNGDELNVDPEIFSPDEDGHNDVVNVHYHFSNSGNVANVIVYDSKGRLIRNLVNNELIGNDGSFSWDGITNSYDKARIGMYIFYIEVFDLNGDTKSFKKTCVLASKL